MNDGRPQAADIDMNRLIPAYLAADAERRQRAMLVLTGGDQVQALAADRACPERLLNQTEVAKVLGVHPTTVRRWCLPCHRLGRVPRYRTAEVMEYIGGQTFRRRLRELKQIRGG